MIIYTILWDLYSIHTCGCFLWTELLAARIPSVPVIDHHPRGGEREGESMAWILIVKIT